jgi:hypothetical protein
MKIEEQMQSATHRRVTIHEVVDSGSAFGVTEDGDMVFINQRIVGHGRKAMDVKAGDVGRIPTTQLPPTSGDDPVAGAAPVDRGPRASVKVKKEVDEKLLHAIVRLLNNEGYLTAAEIAETLDVPLVDIYRTLKNEPGIIMSVPAYFVP